MKPKAKARAAEEEEEEEEARRDREELRQRLEEEEEAEGRLAAAMARLPCHTPTSRPSTGQAASSTQRIPHTPKATAPRVPQTPRTAPSTSWPTTSPLRRSMACDLGFGRGAASSATSSMPLLGGGMMMEVELDPNEEPANVVGKGDLMAAKGRAKGSREDGGGGKGKKGGGDEGFRPIVTPWGTRFHTHRFCPTLANSRNLTMSPWCVACAPDGVGLREPVFCIGPGRTAHANGDCHPSARQYQICNMCLEIEES